MGDFLKLAFDWSEVWTLFIPLAAWLSKRRQPAYLKPVITYLWVALPINIICNIIAGFYEGLPEWLAYNPPFYNLHSIVRFSCFAWFFLSLKQSYFSRIQQLIPIAFLLLAVLNFWFYESFFHKDYLSGNLFTAEAYFLLVYCVLYYLAQLKNEKPVIASGPDFWVVTGLCIYVVINFFIFLFYEPMVREEIHLAVNIWNVHNVAYILLNFFIAKAFYAPPYDYH